MGYRLVAVIGGSGLLGAVGAGFTHARPVALAQGLSLLPVTEELWDEVADGSPVVPTGFAAMPGGFDRILTTWSASGPVAYVEAEYFGGVGAQCAAVWDGAALVYGPQHESSERSSPSTRSPIEAALHRLGVVRGEHRDEFTAVDLGRHRRTEDWLDTEVDPDDR